MTKFILQMFRLALLCLVGVALAQEAAEGQEGSSTDARSGQGEANTRFFGGVGVGVNPGFGGVGVGVNPGFGGGALNPAVASGAVGCRHYCRTPEGAAYCCETSLDPPSTNVFQPPVVKPGQCPLVRPQCPPTRFRPTPCSSDTSCGLNNPLKCCFDRCLGQHVCKSPDPTAYPGAFPGGFQG